ncbi:NAD(P)H-quinone oxidoreductase subunit N, chloroplastic isoform X2 [Canna indica]|uniref:NAD(P)H-quinone oxidoreductase subunit N, chloroplastic isoform X2 n=1 Tax=Canna indica TaxID=4628 RepID=A0AAQ3QJ33_9LILI|nr:NAD(P)H-quinone oxidoreductase subunit N, chloroplastic isoform X2 [Canna indica]
MEDRRRQASLHLLHLLLLLLLSSLLSSGNAPLIAAFGPIKMIIVLVMEQCSFDHLLGWTPLPSASDGRRRQWRRGRDAAMGVRCGLTNLIDGDLVKPDLGRWLEDVEKHKALAIYMPHEGNYEGHYLNRLCYQGYRFLDLTARGLGDPKSTLTKIHPVCPVLSKAELQFLALLPTLRPKVKVSLGRRTDDVEIDIDLGEGPADRISHSIFLGCYIQQANFALDCHAIHLTTIGTLDCHVEFHKIMWKGNTLFG